VAVPELFQATQTAVTRTFRAVELLFLAAILYWLLSFVFAAFLGHIDRRLNTAV
jgi:ABC-type amino acid transport system permease subunit